MEKVKKLLLIALFIFSANILFSGDKITSEIDWPNGVLTVYGYGDIVHQKTGNFMQWQYKAVTDAKQNLMQNFYRALKNLRIDNFHYASSLLLNDQKLSKKIIDYLRNRKKMDLIYYNTYVKVIQKYKYYGLEGFVKDFVSVGSDLDNFPKFNGYIFSTGFTGLVIDARGLGKIPAVSPNIYDEDHNLIYGADFIVPDYFDKWGMVQYTNNPDYSKYIDRVGNNPFRIVALRENKLIETDIEISNEDAEVFLQSELTKKALKGGKVIIILDSEMKEKIK